MTVEEFEKLAVGMDTGYRDMKGNPIRVGDRITYYRKIAKKVDKDDDINTYDQKWIYGDGAQGYVYTGKVVRKKGKVTFSFEYGLDFEFDADYSKFWYEVGHDERLLTILVTTDCVPPKLTFLDLLDE